MHVELREQRGTESLTQRSVLLLCPEAKGLLCGEEHRVSIRGLKKLVGILPSR